MVEFNTRVHAKTATEAWDKWWGILGRSTNDDGMMSRDGAVHNEIINAVTVIEDPTRSFVNSKIRNLPIRYAVGEMLWYMSGNNKLKEIQKYTKNWDRMSDDGECVNSNYGYCIKHKYGFDQWNFVRSLLIKDTTTRQAVIHIKEPNNKPSKDVNCTVCLQFFIRDKKLYLTTYMRSNDLWMGFPYDVFQFMNMQVLMSMELGCELGNYTHIAGSLHLYERDYQTAKKNSAEFLGTEILEPGMNPA